MELFPLSLDGNSINAGQGQEGRPTDDECMAMARKEYIQHLRKEFDRWNVVPMGQRQPTDNELIEMDISDAEYFDKDGVRRFRADIRARLRARELEEKFIDVDASWERNIKRKQEERRLYEASKAKTHAIHTLGSREFTLTYSPKWFDDKTARAKMETAIERLTKYYKDEIVQLRAIGEVGTNGLSHVHCFYKLVGGLKITDKNFKRAWSVWNPKKTLGKSGHEGGHHANVRTESDFLGYIEKDIEEAWLEVNIGGGV